MIDDFLQYGFDVQVISKPQDVTMDLRCNGFTVINTGATLATVNNFPINPTLIPGANGESFSMGGNKGEIGNFRQITIAFPAGNGRVHVIQKFYVKK